MEDDLLKDIEDFRQLRKQLAPLLNDKSQKLLRRIQGRLGTGIQPVPPLPVKPKTEEEEIEELVKQLL